MKLLLLTTLFLTVLFAKEQDEVLLLHSYNKGLMWSDGISKGIHTVFSKHPNIELSTEYMDSKKNSSDAYFESLVQLYATKFKNQKFKAIITADNRAFEFALKHHKTLFHNVPIVFCGLEHFPMNAIDSEQGKLITGVIEYKDIQKNMALISNIKPHLETLYIISDSTLSSLAIKEQILNEAKPFKEKFNVIYDNDIDLARLDEKLKHLPNNSAILFTSLYVDKFKNYIPYKKIEQLFSQSQYPVFALNSIHLGKGVVGGVMIDPQEQGVIVAKKVLEIIKGTPAFKIPIDMPQGKYYFDHEILEKFEINKREIPILATIINQPQNFFDKNREFVNSVFVLVPLLLILLGILLITVVRKIRLEIKLIEQNKLDSVLLNNISNAIFWESNEGIVLGCNDTFCTFLDKNKTEIIGAHIRTLMPKNEKKIGVLQEDFEEKKLSLLNSKDKKIYAMVRRKRYHDKNENVAGIVTVLSDHSHLRKLELQRQKDEQFIIQRSKSSEIGEMVTSIAHQWKKPLIEISTIAQELLFKRKKTAVSLEETQVHVDEIMTQVQYMTTTIDDFRSFIKPSVQESYFSVKEVLKEVFKVIEHNIKYNYIEVDTKFKSKDAFTILGYKNEFKQAIISIINNSIDAIKKRKMDESFEGKIKIKVFYDKNYICISIKDNGVGISKTQLKTVFEPFFTTKKNGDGFGLYMAKILIENKMHGKIRALKYSKGAHIMTCFNKSDKA